MDVVLQGLFALVAVAAGAFGTMIVTRRADNARWERDRKERWDARRLEAYTDYATAVKGAILRARSILGGMGLSPTLTPLTASEGVPLLAADENARTAKLEALMLLATPETIAAAREWHGIAWTFHQWAAGTAATSWDEVEATYVKAQHARERYYAAVRKELDIP